MIKQRCVRILSWTALAIWSVLIFIMSAQTALQSDDLSRGITEKIIDFTSHGISSEVDTIPKMHIVDLLNHFVRKGAHFSAYLVLGILSFNALRHGGADRKKVLVFSFLFCILFAVSDEIHQLFVPQRSGQVTDVFIDSVGAAIGILLHWIVIKRKTKALVSKRQN